MTVSVPAQRRPCPQPQLVGTDLRALDRRSGWVGEQKWDGWRGILDLGAGRLLSRHGTDLSGAFPDVMEAAAALADVVLDGELVCLTDGRPDFHRLSDRRGGCTAKAAARRATTDPAVLVVWDVLHLEDQDLRPRPWSERRSVLDGLGLTADPREGGIAITTVFDDVPALLQATFDLGLEGVVCKQPSSSYRSGVRSLEWIKAKHGYHRDVQADRLIWRRTA
jgi:bifunctional non-homologous end joining protein LigD